MHLKKMKRNIFINLFRSKPFPQKLVKLVKNIKNFLVVDEQTPSGSLASCVYEDLEIINFPKIISKSLPERYFFENGGRTYC